MAYKLQAIEWDVPLSEVQIGIPIGYAAEFSLNSYFSPVLYSINTYNEETEVIQGTFFYSLDGGNTWVDFPLGEHGMIFTTAYKMRLMVNSADVNSIYVEKYGTIYRIRSDGKEIISQYNIGDFNSTGFEIDSRDNSLYVSGQDKTFYKIDTKNGLDAGDNSLNIHSNPLGVAVDGTRNTFWQVNGRDLKLKDLSGNLIFSVDLPEDIDVDYSSSSSISSSSSSSTIP